MRSKYLIALLAIFIVAGSIAAIYAADASIGNSKFEVPNGYKVTNVNETGVLLTNGDKEILVATDIVGNDSINSFFSSKGFKFHETLKGTEKVKGNDLNGEYSYTANTYTKDKGYGIAYMLVKDNKNITVIGIDNNFDDGDNYEMSEVNEPVTAIANQIMLKK